MFHPLTIQDLLQKIDSYTDVSTATRDYAKALIIEVGTYPTCHVCACPEDGEIIFNWVHDKSRLEASIDRDQHLVWIICQDGHVIAGKDIDLHVDSPRDFVDSLFLFRHKANKI